MTHYDILEVSHTASPEVIHAAYMALVKKYHPDLFQDAQDKVEAEERMKQINDAYRVLSSSALRADYDRQLKRPIRESPEHTKAANTEHPAQAETAADWKQNARRQATPPRNTPSGQNTRGGIYRTLVLLIVLAILVLIAKPLFDGAAAEAEAPDDEKSVVIPAPDQTPMQDGRAKPHSGWILEGSEYQDASAITVSAPPALDCVIKLKAADGTTAVSFYVRAGETATVGVPAESLQVYFAAGEQWQGTQALFGAETCYSKDDEAVDFSTGTWRYSLILNHGIYNETPITAEEFW
jgi:curved DNA-binding protein CbpA